MLAFEGVAARYHRHDALALDGVSLSAHRGRVTAVVGPNGSGKSTLVRALLGRITLERGRISIDDVDAGTLSARERARRVAVVPQRESSAFPLPVRELVALGRHPHLGSFSGWGAADEAAVQAAIEQAGIGELVDRSSDELSGGEWQRVRIARALAQHASSLVLDEPTTFVDIAHEMSVFELLASLARGGIAVLLVSHQLNLVARFADQIVLLHRGVVAATGTPAEVMRGDILERVYEWPVVVTRDPAVGAPALVPLRGRRG